MEKEDTCPICQSPHVRVQKWVPIEGTVIVGASCDACGAVGPKKVFPVAVTQNEVAMEMMSMREWYKESPTVDDLGCLTI